MTYLRLTWNSFRKLHSHFEVCLKAARHIFTKPLYHKSVELTEPGGVEEQGWEQFPLRALGLWWHQMAHRINWMIRNKSKQLLCSLSVINNLTSASGDKTSWHVREFMDNVNKTLLSSVCLVCLTCQDVFKGPNAAPVPTLSPVDCLFLLLILCPSVTLLSFSVSLFPPWTWSHRFTDTHGDNREGLTS